MFLKKIKNVFIPVNCDSSVNTFSGISNADVRVSEVSEQACVSVSASVAEHSAAGRTSRVSDASEQTW